MDKSHESPIRPALSANMESLLAVQPQGRDGVWVEAFCRQLLLAKVRVLSAQASLGPDGWPYLAISTDASGEDDMGKILPWLAKRGIGLVVNPQSTAPDFVFTYGMIWHFVEFGYFFRYHEWNADPITQSMNGEANLVCGEPSQKYLPLHVRSILRQFLADQGLLDPRVQMISWDGGKTYDLAFMESSVQTETAESRQDFMEAISWFLPPHYGIAVVPAEGLPAFFPL